MVILQNTKPKITKPKIPKVKKFQTKFKFLRKAKLNSGGPRSKSYEN